MQTMFGRGVIPGVGFGSICHVTPFWSLIPSDQHW
jgi:hypothetical protein